MTGLNHFEAANTIRNITVIFSKRIDAVTDYLSSHGISKDRFDKDIKNTSDPESTEGTLVGKAQNRRVGFETM